MSALAQALLCGAHLLVGLALGWAIWGRQSRPRLTQEQLERQFSSIDAQSRLPTLDEPTAPETVADIRRRLAQREAMR